VSSFLNFGFVDLIELANFARANKQTEKSESRFAILGARVKRSPVSNKSRLVLLARGGSRKGSALS
jgi:hypothetical protein